VEGDKSLGRGNAGCNGDCELSGARPYREDVVIHDVGNHGMGSIEPDEDGRAPLDDDAMDWTPTSSVAGGNAERKEDSGHSSAFPYCGDVQMKGCDEDSSAPLDDDAMDSTPTGSVAGGNAERKEDSGHSSAFPYCGDVQMKGCDEDSNELLYNGPMDWTPTYASVRGI
jgi:hypothetical protein